jgi:hypothetical protein
MKTVNHITVEQAAKYINPAHDDQIQTRNSNLQCLPKDGQIK